jgi:hypothetical protein
MDTLTVLSQNNISWAYSMAYDPVVYYTRNRILGGNNIDGVHQKPFRGNIEYDYQIWIDSDMVWQGSDILKLLQHQKPIVSGCYMMANNQELPIVENLDWDRLTEAGTFKFLNRNDLPAKNTIFKASYVGFGFLAIANGVMETMEYPWFRPRFVQHNDFFDFTAEDVGFCWSAQDLGHEIWVDPSIRIGHQKHITLMP